MRSDRTQFRQSKIFRSIVALLVVMLLWLYTPRFITAPLQAVTGIILQPFQSIGSAAGYVLQSQISFFSSLKTLKQESANLQKENLRLKAENAAQKQAINENEELRRNLELLPREKFNLVGATIISRDTTGLLNTVTINKGSQNGAEVGMPVIVESGVLVGQVVEVFFTTSIIRLITHEESVVNSETTSNAVIGVTRGEHGLSTKLDMVEQGKELKPGDGVVTSGLGGEFPRGLLIGTLGDVTLSEDKLFQQAKVVSPVQLEKLRFVFLLRNK